MQILLLSCVVSEVEFGRELMDLADSALRRGEVQIDEGQALCQRRILP